MIAVFRESGFSPMIRAVPGMIDVEFPTSLTDDAAEVFEERAAEAAHNAVRRLPGPLVGRGGRCVAEPCLDRQPSVPQPDRHRFQRRRVPGESPRDSIHGVAELRIDPGHPRPRRRRVRVCSGGARSWTSSGAAVTRASAGCVVISAGLLRDRRRRSAARTRARGDLPRLRDATDRAELHGYRERGSRRDAERYLRVVLVAPRSRRLHVAVRRLRDRGDGADRAAWVSGSPASSRSGTRQTSRATTCCATGSAIRSPRSILLYLESFGNPRRFARIARRWPSANRSSW